MRNIKIAAALILIHGGLLELGGCLALVPLLAAGGDPSAGQFISFIVPYWRENLSLMLAAGGIWGVLRVIGAAALLQNRLWGLALSVINCVVTLALLIFMLPAGIADGLLASAALILLLRAYCGEREIIPPAPETGAAAPPDGAH